MAYRFSLHAVVWWLALCCGAGCSFNARFQSDASPSANGPAPHTVATAAAGQSSTPSPASAPPSTPATAPGGAIEAGCTYVGDMIRAEVGAFYQVSCPANCQDIGGLWGTDTYSGNSAVCKAGIHAGVVSRETGGTMTIRLDPGRPSYRGSVRNAIRSEDGANWSRSYTVLNGRLASGAALPPGAIEAGCSYIADMIRGEPGAVYQVSCPANCQDVGGLWGTDTYSGNSAMCKAGIHAGLISRETGGVMTVRLEPGRPAYRGSVRNAIRSEDGANWSRSYTVLNKHAAPPPMPAANAIEAGCTYVADLIRGEPGAVYQISCPGNCRDVGGVWGTDTYSGNSTVCRAGIHAGVVSNERGGTMKIRLEPGRPAYRGTVRNGVRSADGANWSRSYAVLH
jgi:hypothetical protein